MSYQLVRLRQLSDAGGMVVNENDRRSVAELLLRTTRTSHPNVAIRAQPFARASGKPANRTAVRSSLTHLTAFQRPANCHMRCRAAMEREIDDLAR